MHYQENTVKSDNKVRIISLLLLLPMYAGVAEAWSVFNKIIYPIFLALVFLGILYKGKIPKLSGRNNIFALFLLYVLLVLVFDFIQGTFTTFEGFNRSKSWEALITALVSFLVITLRVSRREFLLSVILGLAIFYLYRVFGILGIVDIGMDKYKDLFAVIFGKTAYSFVLFSASLLLYISGKRILAIVFIMLVFFQSQRAFIVAFGITIALYHLHTYIQFKKRGINNNSYYGLIKFIVGVTLVTVLVSEISMVFTTGDDFWENITSGRSLFYTAIVGQWVQGGNIIFPAYPGYAAELASTYITAVYGRQFSSSICSHSILIEMMVDYGIIIGLSFILLMVIISKNKGVFATCFFLIAQSFLCEVFAATYFVTYLLVYRYLAIDSDKTGSKVDRYSEDKDKPMQRTPVVRCR